MSENKIAASNPKRRIGCSVTSAASFGAKHISSILMLLERGEVQTYDSDRMVYDA